MKKTILLSAILFGFVSTGLAQNVNIPDTNFKAYLVGNTAINTNSDTIIQTSEASAFTGTISLYGQNIKDLTGIQAFTKLEHLSGTGGVSAIGKLDLTANKKLKTIKFANCGVTSINLTGLNVLNTLWCFSNSLSTLDVSSNIALVHINCRSNQLTSLDLTNNIELKRLECFTNKLTTIDVSKCVELQNFSCYDNTLTSLDVTSNTALISLSCSDNAITSLDVTNNTALTVFGCKSNAITSLDVTNNISLINLTCFSNPLTSLDVSTNTALSVLSCSSNGLTSLDLTQNTMLTYLECGKNSITSLDVSNDTVLTNVYCYENALINLDLSKNTNLIELNCSGNSLTSLHVSNGNNTNFTSFKALQNPDLTCIQVDDVAWSTTNWTEKDATASYNTSCAGGASITEKAIQFDIYPNPTSGILNIKTDKPFTQVEVLDITGKAVKTFTQSSTQLDVADLPNGMYTLQIIGDNEVGYSKFIKK